MAVKNSPSTTVSRSPDQHTSFGLPRGLDALLRIELFERFSYYVIQALLLYYLLAPASDGGLGLDQRVSLSITAAYGGTLYLSAVIGAWVADRILGLERTLYFAAILVNIGYMLLALVPGGAGLAVGLAAVAVGSGGLKVSATTLVGRLYDDRSTGQRNAGFSLFYLGINIGALAAPFGAYWAYSSLGFRAGFGLSAVAMALGLWFYQSRRGDLPSEPPVDPLPHSSAQRKACTAAGVVLGLAVIAFVGVTQLSSLSTFVAIVSTVIAVAYLSVMLTSKKVNAAERRRVMAFIPIFMISVFFWSLYQQTNTTIARFSGADSGLGFTGWNTSVSWVQLINPLMIILLAGVMAYLWTTRKPQLSSPGRNFAVGLAVLGSGFILLAAMHADSEHGSLMQVIAVLALFSCAEILISPVGLAVATKLAPQAFKTQTVALFMLSVSLGTSIAGAYSNPDRGSIWTTATGFVLVGLAAITVGAVVAVARRWIEVPNITGYAPRESASLSESTPRSPAP